MDSVGVDAEPRVGDPAVAEGGRVGEEEIDEETAEGEGNTEAEVAEAAIDLDWCDDARNAG